MGGRRRAARNRERQAARPDHRPGNHALQVERHRALGYRRGGVRLSTGPREGKGKAVSALRSEEHTSELQSRLHLVCRLLLEKKKKETIAYKTPSETQPQNQPRTSC